MSQDEGSLENDDPESVRDLFNRSPHPYHRPSFETPERVILDRSIRPPSLSLKSPGFGLQQHASDKRSVRSSTSASDSGTEADDEKPLLKALTAPPLRPRKGLKVVASEDGTISPPLTQSGHEEEDDNRLLFGHAASIRRERKIGQAGAPRQNPARKGFEFGRRLVEFLLFVCVGWISLTQLSYPDFRTLRHHVFIVASIYVSFIPSMLYRLFQGRKQGKSWWKIWLPASADPASLLYPVFLPLFVAHSVNSQAEDILASYILSLCAIPKQIVFQQDFNVHWVTTVAPLAFKSLYSGSDIIKVVAEELVLLFPLHCALMQTLYFLTTSSLLTTELQLLSVALINLLGVPKTPQASILKALLWVGGLAMFVSCRHVLQLSVELARIPSWRLRRVRRSQPGRSTIFRALDDTFGGFLSRRIFPPRQLDESDSDDESRGLSLIRSLSQRRSGHNRSININTNSTTVDDLAYDRQPATFMEDKEFFGSGMRQRRHTLPSSLSSLPDIPTLTRTATDALSSAKTRSKLIVRLTLPQATVLKWLYAAFTYAITMLVIFVPVRLYVQYFALDGREPIGWALGYLLGDYQPFRMQVVLWNLDSWICLPSRELPLDLSAAEYTRQAVLGAANTRLLLSLYCLCWIAIGLAIVIRLSDIVEVDTRRKVFHGMMVAMFSPTIFVDPAFIALAFTIILAIFLLLDLFRASQLPPLSQPLTHFLAPYVDGRDHKGPIIISHIFLLIGCAIPLWLSLAAMDRVGQGALAGWEVPTRDISMVTGVICVGMGDAAASLVGRRYGVRRWPWSGGKSLEGSTAFGLAVFVGLTLSRAWLTIGGWSGDSGDAWGLSLQKMLVAALGSSLTEAVLTGGNDNVVVPIILWLLTKGLAI